MHMRKPNLKEFAKLVRAVVKTEAVGSTKTTSGLHSHLTPSTMKWKNKLESPVYRWRLEPSDTHPTRLRPLSLCFVYCFGQRDTLCLCAFFPFIAMPHEDFATQRSSDALRHIDMQEEFHCTLTEPRRQDLVRGHEIVTVVPLFLKLTCNTKEDLKKKNKKKQK